MNDFLEKDLIISQELIAPMEFKEVYMSSAKKRDMDKHADHLDALVYSFALNRPSRNGTIFSEEAFKSQDGKCVPFLWEDAPIGVATISVDEDGVKAECEVDSDVIREYCEHDVETTVELFDCYKKYNKWYRRLFRWLKDIFLESRVLVKNGYDIAEKSWIIGGKNDENN